MLCAPENGGFTSFFGSSIRVSVVARGLFAALASFVPAGGAAVAYGRHVFPQFR